ncbi:hypothetical protein A3E49_02200 [Candidatus Saccharibacteria bacterium RIFCSPHIGHO2_12_FULL_49_19]|nr:MAG: hypothetical protein A2708_01310 [Candidatus Saccharibacteria bacterium RIFCSPHIGHO2_01_FULL_49_21]OGL36827.1 MAG: hypothetical protein A3E49_02200 [Candidatus Saccharibacteria bacterium RIFCSPHIGHO2_12_FULL_49_19]OGL37143.1 MAG: hypothetical protein A3B63_00875 [Candidatus Saccharibacteria bacterium RIFCSPLOWO2_01_FULL_49_22]
MAEHRHLKKPIWATLISGLGLLAFASVTSPAENISYSLVVFAIALIFLVSIGYVFTNLRWGRVTPRGRTRIFFVSSLIIVALMLKSSGSLSAIEILVLLLIGAGLWFYSGRRAF